MAESAQKSLAIMVDIARSGRGDLKKLACLRYMVICDQGIVFDNKSYGSAARMRLRSLIPVWHLPDSIIYTRAAESSKDDWDHRTTLGHPNSVPNMMLLRVTSSDCHWEQLL